jgi:hypothetical protein
LQSAACLDAADLQFATRLERQSYCGRTNA